VKQTVTQKAPDGSATTVQHEQTPQPAQPAAPAQQAPPAIPAIPASLGADPQFNAFLAAQGLTQANLRDAAALQQGNLLANRDQQSAQISRMGALAQAHGDNSFDSRGTLNSGAAVQNEAQIGANTADRLAALQNATAQKIAAVYNSLGLKLASGNAQQATTGNNLAGKDYVNQTVAGPNPFMAAATAGL
jgi:hypothetical protein